MGELCPYDETTNVIPFQFDGHDMRVKDRNGEPWFVLTDICQILEIANPTRAASRLDQDEKHTLHNMKSRAGTGPQSLIIINESGLFSLILTSRKPEAKRFKKWITSEVLPSIRKEGSYSLAVENDPQDVVTKLAPDIMGFLGDMMKGVVQRVIEDQLPQAIDARLTQDPQLAAVRHLPALQVAIDQGIRKRPRGFAQKISGSLTRYCEQMNVVYLRDAHNVKLFPKEIISSWIAEGGWREIEDYLIRKGVIRRLRMI